ncbi:YwqI/YxiC family protein [Metabacillus arenae]|uniref:YwqI/YxiC family protein n=1 Tax=Metabacillus arenae TaxID=2771434 RepID=A0A926RWJ4_9BACI|nr:YwqI/YxiC family protein [Metabacillus arenae]MBD1379640.1 YwqI/YxiC family protein [Metabacillus arenae]
MGTIKLNHGQVMQQLDDVKRALDTLNLPAPGALGQNKLNFTDGWLSREANLQKMVSEYMKVVQKNVEDTRSNVTSLKEQDEAVVRN